MALTAGGETSCPAGHAEDSDTRSSAEAAEAEAARLWLCFELCRCSEAPPYGEATVGERAGEATLAAWRLQLARLSEEERRRLCCRAGSGVRTRRGSAACGDGARAKPTAAPVPAG